MCLSHLVRAQVTWLVHVVADIKVCAGRATRREVGLHQCGKDAGGGVHGADRVGVALGHKGVEAAAITELGFSVRTDIEQGVAIWHLGYSQSFEACLRRRLIQVGAGGDHGTGCGLIHRPSAGLFKEAIIAQDTKLIVHGVIMSGICKS